jgi:hypothetical protein
VWNILWLQAVVAEVLVGTQRAVVPVDYYQIIQISLHQQDKQHFQYQLLLVLIRLLLVLVVKVVLVQM